MEQSPSWETNGSSLCQWSPTISMNSECPLPCAQEPATCPCTDMDKPNSSYSISLRFILVIICHLRRVSEWCLSFIFLCMPSLLPSVPMSCPLHTFLHFIMLVLFGEQYKSLSSSLRYLLHSTFTSSLLGPNIFLSTKMCDTVSHSLWETKFHTHTNQQAKL